MHFVVVVVVHEQNKILLYLKGGAVWPSNLSAFSDSKYEFAFLVLVFLKFEVKSDYGKWDNLVEHYSWIQRRFSNVFFTSKSMIVRMQIQWSNSIVYRWRGRFRQLFVTIDSNEKSISDPIKTETIWEKQNWNLSCLFCS